MYSTSTTSASRCEIVAPNFLTILLEATSDNMTTEIPNPSSELASFPGSNFLDPDRSAVWIPRGLFRIYDSTIKGYVFAPCRDIQYKLKLADPWSTVTLDEGDYTAYELAAEIKAKLDADTGNNYNNTFQVIFDDRKRSGDAATFKWTITCNNDGSGQDGLWLLSPDHPANDNALAAIGWNIAISEGSAGTYSLTGHHPAIHTEEYIIFGFPEDFRAGQSASNDTHLAPSAMPILKWLAFLDCSFRYGRISGTFGNSYDTPKQAPTLYAYEDVGDTIEFDQNESSFTEGGAAGNSKYSLPLTSGSFESYVGNNGQIFLDRYVGTTDDVMFQNMTLLNMASWDSTWNWDSVNLRMKRWIKFKFSDPRHPEGRVILGTMPCGPAWSPGKTYNFSSRWSKVDPSKLTYTGANKRWSNTARTFYRKAQLDYRRAAINSGKTNAAYALTEDSPAIELMERLYERKLGVPSEAKDYGAILAKDPHASSLGKGRVPFLLVDQSQDPFIAGTNKVSGTEARLHHNCGFAMYCYFDRDIDWEKQFKSRWGMNLSLREETL